MDTGSRDILETAFHPNVFAVARASEDSLQQVQLVVTNIPTYSSINEASQTIRKFIEER